MASEAAPSHADLVKIAENVQGRTKYRPTIGIICGSGLGGLADQVSEAETFDYKDIPGFPTSTVQGHAGKLVFGMLSGQQCVCMKGRFHPYEGYPLWKVILPVRVLHLLGVKTLIVTNAAGGLNTAFNIGDIMIINDHIDIGSLAGNNALVGPHEEQYGVRFVSMQNAYDKDLRGLAQSVVQSLGMVEFVREGVYVKVGGPSYETPAESRLLRLLGADAVGMSTTPEVIAARQCGVRVLGISLVTNIVITDTNLTGVGPTHEEVLETGRRRAKDMENLVKSFVAKLQ
eukprot:scpid63681/ scgid32812/ Purine nucleoside phosphorylase; Inosine phosphorylase